MTGSEEGPSRAGAPVALVALVVAAVVGGLVWVLGRDAPEPERRAMPAAAAERPAEPASPASGGREIRPGVFEPGEDGKLTIPAAALERGGPIRIELALAPEEIGDQAMTASIRSAGTTHELGEAELDPATGRAALSIDPSRLPAGQHLLAIRVADDSWNPTRRVAITVTR